MPGQAAKITITEHQYDILRTLHDAVTAPSHLRQRTSILLLAFDGLRNDEIAEQVGLGQRSVGLWRRRWAKAWNRLIDLECGETHAALRRAIEAVLTEGPRPAHRSSSPQSQSPRSARRLRAPEKSGRPIPHWTAHELAVEVVKRGIVAAIATSQVGRSLREAAMQPHTSRSWLNTTEKAPERFQEQVEAVCDTYRRAPAWERTQNTHTVCVDEMTDIQALERTAATKPRIAGEPARLEFESERHGTLTLIGNFQVTTGELIISTLGPTRTEADFASHIKQAMAIDPGASWVFVTENLNIPCSETLVRVVAKACEIPMALGKKGIRGVLGSVASRKAFLSEPGHRIRFVYTPKHSSWLNQIEVVFGVIMREVTHRGSFTSVTDLYDKLSNFIQYFNRAFTHTFRWTYTGRPLMAKPAA